MNWLFFSTTQICLTQRVVQANTSGSLNTCMVRHINNFVLYSRPHVIGRCWIRKYSPRTLYEWFTSLCIRSIVGPGCYWCPFKSSINVESFVFNNYTWSRKGVYSDYNGKLIPAQIPMSAFISGMCVWRFVTQATSKVVVRSIGGRSAAARRQKSTCSSQGVF